MRFLNLSVAALAFFWSIAAAQDSDSVSLGSKITVSGVVDFSMGEVMKGKYRSIKANGNESIKYGTTVSHAWFGNPLARLNLELEPSEKIKTIIGFEGNIFLNSFPPQLKTILSSNGGLPVLPQFMDWRLHQAQGIFSIVDNESMSLSLAIGLMPYKYNPEVRNLGEFLFRTGTYPFFIINSFNFPQARLSGARLNLRWETDPLILTVDQFILTERNMPPMNDVSIATIASIKALKVFDAGLGVDFARVIPLNGDLTTPREARFVRSPGDTGYYSFKATKIMARATIDPVGTLRGGESVIGSLFGETGGKIYGEIAITGLTDYPASKELMDGTDPLDIQNPWGYTKLSERMPWMAGINIPLWKILDVCAFEIEKYPAPYPNDYYQAFLNKGLPLPTWYHAFHSDTSGYDSAAYAGNRWYWSVYMKKQVVRHFSVLAQVSRDHMRWDISQGFVNNYDTEEIMALPGQWAWRMGMLFEF